MRLYLMCLPSSGNVLCTQYGCYRMKKEQFYDVNKTASVRFFFSWLKQHMYASMFFFLFNHYLHKKCAVID